MSDATAEVDSPKKSAVKPVLFALIAAVLLGSATFSALYFDVLGMFTGSEGRETDSAPRKATEGSQADDVAFVPIPPLTISLNQDTANRHLRFSGQLEVETDRVDSVSRLMPRVSDVLNSYLSALNALDVERPAALVILRAQMLRRVQLVTGTGMVRDLLVTEFVLN